uniref:Ubiquinol-cytochrome c reductase subunit 6 n=1 Tax=Kwoniella dejecticola CBS 10117 TaxID=1296121 RepID=A0A1A5ZTT5_9TREE|nr:ubiquinol-cytochrome c reductase subunit 6 [Kwoniella dejecticola CBS 10117]OBR81221.1 ubiquinol-cytochrome c reductase subunit 6 [Kwoniella dejecticola CBS 10117]
MLTLMSCHVMTIYYSAHAEAPEESEEPAEEGGEDSEEKDEEEEEEEEEEPEDPAPAIREECEQKTCAEHVHHFKHCQEKVEAGNGFPGEDCVEEFFHVLHCVDQCAAPKIFKKLA